MRSRDVVHWIDFVSLYTQTIQNISTMKAGRNLLLVAAACCRKPIPGQKAGRQLHGICTSGAVMFGMYVTLKVCPGVSPLGTTTSRTCPQGVLTGSVCPGETLQGTVTDIVTRGILPKVGPMVMAGMDSFGRVRHQQEATMPQHTRQHSTPDSSKPTKIATGLCMLEQLLL